MSKILLLGVGPLPIENPERLHAPGLRLWNFADTLAKHNHSITLLQLNFGDWKGSTFTDISKPENIANNIQRFFISLDFEKTPKYIQELYKKYPFDCIIATTDIMNKIAALSNIPVSKWFDYNGHSMAEAQLIAATYKNDEQLLTQWLNLVPALLCGDYFSTCSTPEKYALIGELGACGRLNQFTAHTDLVVAIPPSPAFTQFKHTKNVVKGKRCPQDAFVILSTGGYNTWVDSKTLFDGLIIAMEKNPNIYFVSLGGEIKGHNEKTFQEFQNLVRSSKFKERFIFCGWVPTEDVQNYYFESDAAINIDNFSYEAMLGFRNRILEWLQAKVPILSTALSELTITLAEKDLIYSFQIGSSIDLANKIQYICEHKQEAIAKAENAYKYVNENYSPEKTLLPLLEWANKPRFAPDNKYAMKNNLPTNNEGSFITNKLSELQYNAQSANEKITELEKELYTLKGKKIFKLFAMLKENFPFLFKQEK